jgi:hypothetical protein
MKPSFTRPNEIQRIAGSSKNTSNSILLLRCCLKWVLCYNDSIKSQASGLSFFECLFVPSLLQHK